MKQAWARFLEDSSFLRHYMRKYRKLVVLGLLSLLVLDGLEVIPPLLIKWAVDAAVEGDPRAELFKLAGVFMAISIVQGFCRYAWRMYLIRASMLAGRDLRDRFVQSLFGQSMSFFDRRKTGDLMSLATSDVEAVRNAMGPGLLTLADALFQFLTIPVAMIILSPKLALLAFIPLPLIPWIVMRNEREIHARFNAVQQQASELSSLAQEGIQGIRVIKSFSREDLQVGRFAAAGREFVRRSLKLARVQSAFGPTLDFAMSLGLVLLLFVGGSQLVQGDAAVTLGTFVAFQRYIQKLVWPMAAMGLALTYYQRSISSSERLKEALRERSDIVDPAGSPFDTPAAVAPDASVPGPRRISGEIELKRLHFAFPGAKRAALREVSLRVEPGQRIAFVGSVGCGKSALLSLLPRLYPVSRNMLFVDGIDINDWSADEIRKQIGYVSQDVFLFSESVLENVGFGFPMGLRRGPLEERQAEAVNASRLSAVHEDIERFPESYATLLRERGTNLSGGQRQRLTLARAVAAKPSILILDDALAAVDVATEELILSNLRATRGTRTELVSSHRISSVADADRIFVLEQGAIVQEGGHHELVRQRFSHYWSFHEQQRLKQDLNQFADALREHERPSL